MTQQSARLPNRSAISWSGGKDSAWALYRMQLDDGIEPVALLTTFDSDSGVVPMQSIPIALVEAQAAAAGLPLVSVALKAPCTDEAYAQVMLAATDRLHRQYDASHIAFGDLFLDDIRQYRESRLADAPLSPIFPNWGLDTRELAMTMIESGQKAIVSCVDTSQLSTAFVGREFDHAFLQDLPESIDACGENGEFHTFVYDSPAFNNRLVVRAGERVSEGRFHWVHLQLDAS